MRCGFGGAGKYPATGRLLIESTHLLHRQLMPSHILRVSLGHRMRLPPRGWGLTGQTSSACRSRSISSARDGSTSSASASVHGDASGMTPFPYRVYFSDSQCHSAGRDTRFDGETLYDFICSFCSLCVFVFSIRSAILQCPWHNVQY